MIKLKKKKITNLLNYQQFLKNNKFEFKKILYENPILYNNINLESHVIEFNNYSNIYLPFTLIKIHEISTIKQKYENTILFDYDLNYNILNQFNQVMFQYISKHNNNNNFNLIKGRILGGNWNNKKIFISILGIIFFMKPINLNNALNFKKKNYFKKFNKKGFYWKKINSTRLVNCYKLKYLNFKINYLNISKKNKKELSRLDYIQNILKKKNKLNNNFKQIKVFFP